MRTTMKRLAASLLLGLALPAWTAQSPNILIILADDLGYSDLGCYGGEIDTPNLDALAADGLRFTQFYNTARCWPSRAALLTGYYAQQVRRDTLPGVPSGAQGVRPRWARLLPEMLRPLGYRAYHSGKWHLDGQPLEHGFDRSYRLEDHDRYFTPRRHFADDRPLPPVTRADGYYATTAIADHAREHLRAHAAEHPDQPFFHFLCFTSPHFPLHAWPEDIAKYRDRYRVGWDQIRQQRWQRQRAQGIVRAALPTPEPAVVPSWNLAEDELRRRVGPGEAGRALAWHELSLEQQDFQAAKMAVHAAMVDRMDREIGRVVNQLKAMGALDDTLILFLSDNGASAEQIIRGDGHDPAASPGSAASFLGLGPGWSTAANTPLRLHKSWVHEGGIATPLIVHWPRGFRARGEIRQNPGHLIDLVPTLLEAAGGRQPRTWDGVAVPPAPGKSLVPVFTRDGGVSHDYLWWCHEGNRAVRVGRWKLVSAGQGPSELYDLRNDRTETTNLAAQQPRRTRQLELAWRTHYEEFRALAARDLALDREPAAPAANR
jgi:arylsulfatase